MTSVSESRDRCHLKLQYLLLVMSSIYFFHVEFCTCYFYLMLDCTNVSDNEAMKGELENLANMLDIELVHRYTEVVATKMAMNSKKEGSLREFAEPVVLEEVEVLENVWMTCAMKMSMAMSEFCCDEIVFFSRCIPQ